MVSFGKVRPFFNIDHCDCAACALVMMKNAHDAEDAALGGPVHLDATWRGPNGESVNLSQAMADVLDDLQATMGLPPRRS